MRANLLRSFAGNKAGVSALEFALILPIMVTLYLGGVEIGSALTINRKVTHVTSALSDLVTQSKTLSNADVTNILDAAASILVPYDTSLLKIRLTEVYIDSAGIARAKWSSARNDTAYTAGQIVPIPVAIATPDTWLVTAEVHYTYTPTIGYIMTGNFDLQDKFYLRPRLVDCVKRTGTGAYACPTGG
jgi:Flp pilus assembly protein TadG